MKTRYDICDGNLVVTVSYEYLSALESCFIQLGSIYRHGGIENWAKKMAQDGFIPVYKTEGYWIEFENDLALNENEARKLEARE